MTKGRHSEKTRYSSQLELTFSPLRILFNVQATHTVNAMFRQITYVLVLNAADFHWQKLKEKVIRKQQQRQQLYWQTLQSHIR